MPRPHHFVGPLLLCLAMACGCGGGDGPPTGEVTGTVSFQSSPVSNATVMFFPEKGPLATATTDSEGRYSASVPVGKAKVTVQVAASGGQKPPAALAPPNPADPDYASKLEAYKSAAKSVTTAQPTSVFPEKYSDAKSTPLAYEVKSGSQEYPIVLEK